MIGKTRAARTIVDYVSLLFVARFVALPRASCIQHARYLGLQARRHERGEDSVALSTVFRSEGEHDAKAPIAPFHRCKMSMPPGNRMASWLGIGPIMRI